jgi:hypothetical protein
MIDSETPAAHRKRRSILEVSWSDRSISSKGGDTGGTSGRKSKEGAWIVSVGLEPMGGKERSKTGIPPKEAEACQVQVVDWINRSIVIYASSESASETSAPSRPLADLGLLAAPTHQYTFFRQVKELVALHEKVRWRRCPA